MKINTEDEYRAALARIDPLLDAKLGTPEGDELEMLSAAIEEYEARVYPIGEPTPEEARAFRAEQEQSAE